eukprot:1842975-Amphidinium_carterae.1
MGANVVPVAVGCAPPCRAPSWHKQQPQDATGQERATVKARTIARAGAAQKWQSFQCARPTKQANNAELQRG